MGREITAIFRMGTFWMLARGRVKWLTVGSRQYSGRSREEKADEEGEGRSGAQARGCGWFAGAGHLVGATPSKMQGW